jgi:hypothetical protein
MIPHPDKAGVNDVVAPQELYSALWKFNGFKLAF